MNSKPFVHNLVICSNVIIRKDGKYLLLKRSSNKKYAPNFIHPFGGKLDENENPYQAALREVKEEIGIEIFNLKLEAVITEIKPDDNRPENWVIFYFMADYKSGDVLDNEEGEPVYLSENELRRARLFPSFKSILSHILNPDDGTVFTTNSYSGFESGMKELSKDICVVK